MIQNSCLDLKSRRYTAKNTAVLHHTSNIWRELPKDLVVEGTNHSQPSLQKPRHLIIHPQMHHPFFRSHNMTNTVSGHTGILHRLGEVDADGDEDAVYLSPLALGLAALLLIINGLLSAYLSLGLHKTLGIAAVRQVAQPLHMQLLCSYLVILPSLH